jgi:homoserine dehydrogenase
MGQTAVGIGVLGCGNVGAALVSLLLAERKEIAERSGVDLSVIGVAVRSESKERGVDLSGIRVTRDASSLVADPQVEVVCELIGGIEPARTLVLQALELGKPVVSANKELLANCGRELAGAARRSGVPLLFEASVAAALPVVRMLTESLVGERISRLVGIVNGTTNFVLSRMTAEGVDYAEALAEAQRLGYAERDPTADVEGHDAAAKAAILASIAFGRSVVAGDVYCEGIDGIGADEIAFAAELGYTIKLLAIAELLGGDRSYEVAVRVHPTMLRQDHPLASVHDSLNAVYLEGAAAGELMVLGRGAGGLPTASAVLGDVIAAARALGGGAVPVSPALGAEPASIRPMDDLSSAFFLRLDVVDQPGVLAAVAEVLGRHRISVRSMEQIGIADEARLLFVTHLALERDMQATLADLRRLEPVRRVGAVLRVLAEP